MNHPTSRLSSPLMHPASIFEPLYMSPSKVAQSSDKHILGGVTSAPSTTTTSPQGLFGSSDRDHHDDGSVASKLLASIITKSVSSPSLMISSTNSPCKESVRETPYQKSLKLKRMKLQHCAEELGSESSSSDYYVGDYCSPTYGLRDAPGFFSTETPAHHMAPNPPPPSEELVVEINRNRAPPTSANPIITVRSSPNLTLNDQSNSTNSNRHYMNHCISNAKSTKSFPPPLSHTLPTSSNAYDTSSGGDSVSLRAYREDGRFVLKEVKVNFCRRYFHADRKNGRLTLHLLTRDDDHTEDSELAPTKCDTIDDNDNHDMIAQELPQKNSDEHILVSYNGAMNAGSIDSGVEILKPKVNKVLYTNGQCNSMPILAHPKLTNEALVLECPRLATPLKMSMFKIPRPIYSSLDYYTPSTIIVTIALLMYGTTCTFDEELEDQDHGGGPRSAINVEEDIVNEEGGGITALVMGNRIRDVINEGTIVDDVREVGSTSKYYSNDVGQTYSCNNNVEGGHGELGSSLTFQGTPSGNSIHSGIGTIRFINTDPSIRRGVLYCKDRSHLTFHSKSFIKSRPVAIRS